MGRPAGFVGANFRLIGDGKTVGDMDALRHDGVLWSSWELSDEELLDIIRSRRVWVGLWCGEHRPFPLTVTGHGSVVMDEARKAYEARVELEKARQAEAGHGGGVLSLAQARQRTRGRRRAGNTNTVLPKREHPRRRGTLARVPWDGQDDRRRRCLWSSPQYAAGSVGARTHI